MSFIVPIVMPLLAQVFTSVLNGATHEIGRQSGRSIFDLVTTVGGHHNTPSFSRNTKGFASGSATHKGKSHYIIPIVRR